MGARGELFAGAPSLMVVKMLSHKFAMNMGSMSIMLLDVQTAILYGKMRTIFYVELPEQDPVSRNQNKMGRIVNAM